MSKHPTSSINGFSFGPGATERAYQILSSLTSPPKTMYSYNGRGAGYANPYISVPGGNYIIGSISDRCCTGTYSAGNSERSSRGSSSPP